MRQIDIHKLADEATFNPFHRRVLLWCALIAPIVIGVLVGMALPLQQNFIAIAIPAVIGMVAVLLIDHGRSASAHHEDLSIDLSNLPTGTPAVSVRH